MPRKGLHVATDIYDEFYFANGFYDKSHIDSLMAYVAGLGATRMNWVFAGFNGRYDNYPGGFDLIREAVDAAHRHGLEFFITFKPFEGAIPQPLPLTLPHGEGCGAVWDERGIYPRCDPFAAANPHLRIERRPGTHAFSGSLRGIRLIKADDKPTRIKASHLSIWTSKTQNHFERYEGPVHFTETIERRHVFPSWRDCRVLTLDGLNIPEDHRYIIVRCELADASGDFTNERRAMLEVVNDQSQLEPWTHSGGPYNFDKDFDGHLWCNFWQEITEYGRRDDVRNILGDREAARPHFEDAFNFGSSDVTKQHTLDGLGYFAFMRGRPRYLHGALHPIYPEVREHWLDDIRFCIDRGADGADIRLSNHSTHSNEPWEYGFNAPVLERAGGSDDLEVIARVNGDSFTLFLQEAAKLLHEHGKQIGIHLNATMLERDARGTLSRMPANFDWQWRKWVIDIVDQVQLKSMHMVREWDAHRLADIYTAVANAAGKPVSFISSNKEVDFCDHKGGIGHDRVRWEMDFVRNHPRIDTYELYETAQLARLDDTGRFVGSDEVAPLLRQHLWAL